MKRLPAWFALVSLVLVIPVTAFAGTSTVVLSVEGMT